MIYNGFTKGEYKSEYIQDGFSSMVNVDIDSKRGTCKGQLALKVDSTNPNENSILVMTPSGIMYSLSKTSGKIWQRLVNGTWSLAHTNTNGAHAGGGFFNNRLWFATSTKLGDFDLSSTWTDTRGTFDNTTTVRPFIRGGVNRAFAYFGDGAKIARVDKDNIFASNALEIPLGETITDIQEWGNDLVMTAIGINSKIYRWNQYGDTYYSPDLIAYKDVDMLIQSQNSNITYALVRTKDDYVEFMYYTGQELSEVAERRISDTTDADSYMKTEFNGKIHFAVNTKIYTIKNGSLVCEYTAPYSIQSMENNGDTLFIDCGTNGVYTLDTNRADAVIETPVTEGKAKQVICNYDTLPTGTSISLKVKINGGNWTTATFTQEEENNRYVMRDGFPAKNINIVQAQITLVHSTTTTPIIRSIEIL